MEAFNPVEFADEFGEIAHSVPRLPQLGDDPLPSLDEAMTVPLRSFRSGYLRIACGKFGGERYLAEMHISIAGRGDTLICDIIPRPQHGERCRGEPYLM